MKKVDYKNLIVGALVKKRIMDIFEACEYFERWWKIAVSGQGPLWIQGFTKEESIEILTKIK